MVTSTARQSQRHAVCSAAAIRPQSSAWVTTHRQNSPLSGRPTILSTHAKLAGCDRTFVPARLGRLLVGVRLAVMAQQPHKPTTGANCDSVPPPPRRAPNGPTTARAASNGTSNPVRWGVNQPQGGRYRPLTLATSLRRSHDVTRELGSPRRWGSASTRILGTFPSRTCISLRAAGRGAPGGCVTRQGGSGVCSPALSGIAGPAPACGRVPGRGSGAGRVRGRAGGSGPGAGAGSGRLWVGAAGRVAARLVEDMG
jgi:hypothetical protein